MHCRAGSSSFGQVHSCLHVQKSPTPPPVSPLSMAQFSYHPPAPAACSSQANMCKSDEEQGGHDSALQQQTLHRTPPCPPPSPVSTSAESWPSPGASQAAVPAPASTCLAPAVNRSRAIMANCIAAQACIAEWCSSMVWRLSMQCCSAVDN